MAEEEQVDGDEVADLNVQMVENLNLFKSVFDFQNGKGRGKEGLGEGKSTDLVVRDITKSSSNILKSRNINLPLERIDEVAIDPKRKRSNLGYREDLNRIGSSLADAKVWNVVKVPLMVERSSVTDWMFCWLSEFKMEEKALVAAICWHLWINRKKHVWKNKMGTTEIILADASTQILAWNIAHIPEVQLRLAELEQGDGRVRWCPSSQGFLKANIDAAVFSGNNGIGIGAVVRDWQETVNAQQIHLLCNLSPRMGETIGIKEVLSWLKNSQNLIIESDAIEVVLEPRNRA